MNKIRAIIVDDEQNGRENLHRSLEKYCPEVEVVAEADSVLSGIEAIQQYTPDLVFLDIEMPEGKGFKILEFFSDPGFDVIFVTAYDQYAIQAIRFSALDYVLKPINIIELRAAVDRVGQHKKRERRLLNQFLHNTRSELSGKKLPLASGNKIEFRPVGQIVRCQSDGNYTNFYFTEGPPLLVTKTLNDFEEILEGYGFIRTHKAHLINTMFIRSFHKNDGGYLQLTDGTSIPVSRRRKDEILTRLKHL
ncbi:MAG: LytTR family DNA-binding domain-containing protein [Prolixibacteraceae bacterium]